LHKFKLVDRTKEKTIFIIVSFVFDFQGTQPKDPELVLT